MSKVWRGKAVIPLQEIQKSMQPRYLIEDAYIRLLIQSYRGIQPEEEKGEKSRFTLPGLILSSFHEHAFNLIIVVEIYESMAHYELVNHRLRMGTFPSPGLGESIFPEDNPNHFNLEIQGGYGIYGNSESSKQP